MAGPKQVPEPWRSFLQELDQRATEETRLDCMGGFVVTVLYGFSRETSDLDVLLIAPREQGKSLFELGAQGGTPHKKYKVYLDYVGVAKVPENYEQRLTEMFAGQFKHLRICALDPYDLAAAVVLVIAGYGSPLLRSMSKSNNENQPVILDGQDPTTQSKVTRSVHKNVLHAEWPRMLWSRCRCSDYCRT
jgi:hypothetical protein